MSQPNGDRPDIDLAAVQVWRSLRNLGKALLPEGESWLGPRPAPAPAPAPEPQGGIPSAILEEIFKAMDNPSIAAITPMGLMTPLQNLRRVVQEDRRSAAG